MSIKVQEPAVHFKAYYQDNSLLIQLILNELGNIYEYIAGFKRLEKTDTTNQRECLQHLRQYLIDFIGEVSKGDSVLACSTKKGPLTRFKEYWEHFFYNEGYSQEHHHLKMAEQVERIWLKAADLLQLIHSRHSFILDKAEACLLKIQKKLQALLSIIDSTAKHFLHFLKEFTADENVIFFLLRKKHLLFTIYDSDKIIKLFKSFSKNQNVMHLLINRFKSRGFDHLLPAIKQELFIYESYKNRQN